MTNNKRQDGAASDREWKHCFKKNYTLIDKMCASTKDMHNEEALKFDSELYNEEGKTYDICLDGSVMKTVLKAGNPEEKGRVGLKATVAYIGKLHNTDIVFDSNNEFDFTIGKGVIQGWSDAVATMHTGEVAKVVIQPHKAYGSQSIPKIPANSTLEFQITLTHLHTQQDLSKAKDQSILLKEVKSVPQGLSPTPLSQCTTSFTLYETLPNGDRNLLLSHPPSSPLILTLDNHEPSLADIYPNGLEQALLHMYKGQVAHLTLAASQSFPQGPYQNKPLFYENLTLIDFTPEEAVWNYSSQERVEYAQRLKSYGNQAFGDSKNPLQLPRAIRLYKKALDSIDSLPEVDLTRPVMLSLCLNLSQCYLRMKDWEKARECSERALSLDSQNVKALFRLGLALCHLGELEGSLGAFRRALEIDSEDAAIRGEFARVKAMLAKEREREKKRFGGMFQKLSGFASDDRPAPVEVEENHSHGHHHHHEGGCCGGH